MFLYICTVIQPHSCLLPKNAMVTLQECTDSSWLQILSSLLSSLKTLEISLSLSILHILHNKMRINCYLPDSLWGIKEIIHIEDLELCLQYCYMYCIATVIVSYSYCFPFEYLSEFCICLFSRKLT